MIISIDPLLSNFIKICSVFSEIKLAGRQTYRHTCPPHFAFILCALCKKCIKMLKETNQKFCLQYYSSAVTLIKMSLLVSKQKYRSSQSNCPKMGGQTQAFHLHGKCVRLVLLCAHNTHYMWCNCICLVIFLTGSCNTKRKILYQKYIFTSFT